MDKSTRKRDMEIEKHIASFCDEHMYCNGMSFKRCNDSKLQRSGIDGYLTIPSLGIEHEPADEKCCTHYVNLALSTYVMELSQITRKGEEVDGWFLDKNSKTKYYIIMYPHAEVQMYYRFNNNHNKKELLPEWVDITEENITGIEYYIIKKSNIMKYLEEKCGFDEKRLRNGVKYLRENKEVESIPIGHGVKFVKVKMQESPINLCIERWVFNDICEKHGFASKFDNERNKN